MTSTHLGAMMTDEQIVEAGYMHTVETDEPLFQFDRKELIAMVRELLSASKPAAQANPDPEYTRGWQDCLSMHIAPHHKSLAEQSAVVLDDERASKLVEALEETQGLLVAMLHETRPRAEIEAQIGDNRTALQAFARAASPQAEMDALIADNASLLDSLTKEATARCELEDRLTAQPAQTRALTGWRPIDTAPKNGSWLMLFARYPTATVGTPHFGYFEPSEGKWYEGGNLGRSEIIPSHWMQRPAFPADAQPASGGDHE